MPPSEKIFSSEQLADIVSALKADGKTVVLCHGVFDLLHVGHLRYFREAKAMGDILVVTLTTDSLVNKGPNRPAFPEQLRAEMLAALDCIDFVAVNRWPTAVEIISLIKPDLYVKGPDYKDAALDITGNLSIEEQAVRAHGGKLAITSDVTFSSTNLINKFMPSVPKETQAFLTEFAARNPSDNVLSYIHGAGKLKVLLVGETIIDEYVYCTAIGKSSKEPTLVVKSTSDEKFAGGILAAANHVSAFSSEVGVVTQIGGNANSHLDFIERALRPQIKRFFLTRQNSPTILKRRMVESYFFLKLLEVYEINDDPISQEDDDAICKTLLEEIPKYDVVIVIDFGHSMLSERAISILQSKSKFLAVNAQSNAGNLGHHTLSRYSKPDLMSATETEVRLEARNRTGEIRKISREVQARIGAKQMVVTRGKNGCICLDSKGETIQVPAIAGKIVDRIGAGDAFLSLAALAAAQGAPMEVVGLIGNAAAAQAVATVGNRDPVDKVALMKHIVTLLK